MAAALSLMIIFVISFSIVRVSSTVLRLTGLSEGQARFQALSALTGTGFTTAEAELIVNFPLRRKIVSYLMMTGNLGLVSVMSTLMISFLRTDADLNSILIQLAWIFGSVGMLSFLMLHPTVDRYMCGAISALLKRYTLLGRRRFNRLLQLGNEISVAEHHIPKGVSETLQEIMKNVEQATCIALRKADGRVLQNPAEDSLLKFGDLLYVIGSDTAHAQLSPMKSNQVILERA